MHAVGWSATLRMPNFVPHYLLLLTKRSCSRPAPLSNLPRALLKGMASSFFKPMFQIVLDPPIRDIVKCSGERLFSRGVSYVLAPLISYL
jgi:hypothetical protein